MSVKTALDAQGFAPRKKWGQNFLTDEHILNAIADAAELTPADAVLEIGPGLGHLTRVLARRAGRVTAVEVDPGLAAKLSADFSDRPNVRIVHGDVLALEPIEFLNPAEQTNTPTTLTPGLRPGAASAPRPAKPAPSAAVWPRAREHPSIADAGIDVPNLQLAPSPPAPLAPAQFKIVANLPYYITSATLRHILESAHKPKLVVVMVQREVAQRMAAQPPEMNLLAVSVQFFARVRIVRNVPAGAFSPRPNVDSAIVRLDVADPLPLAVEETDRFFNLVRAGFGERRKQLRNALAHGLSIEPAAAAQALTRAQIDPARRAETLTLSEWGALHQELGQREP